MDVFQPVDRYCERTGPELWSEPLNAVSNLSFIVAGALILGLARKDRDLRVFGWLVVLVGIGSATFHTVATLWAQAADVLPIAVCLVWFLWAYTKSWRALVAFGAVSGLLAAWKSPAWVNDSHQYLGALLALVLLAATRPEARSPFAWAAATFALSLTLRTLDPLVCDAWPAGTHFLWHALNGIALFLAAKALVASRPDLR